MPADATVPQPPSDPASEPTGPVGVLLVLGPHRVSTDLGRWTTEQETPVESLQALVRVVVTGTEAETVAAVSHPCEALVLDPGSLETFSGSTADAIRGRDVPVIIARGCGYATSPALVATAATASITGGGAAAYDAAVQAAAQLAWERRSTRPEPTAT